MDKLDLKKELDSYRARSGEFRILQVPTLRYLQVDGHGDPNTSPQYADALASLYPVAYKLKFLSKQELGRDYVVPPLEALWWAQDMAAFTSSRDKSQWDWTVMLMVPPWLDEGHVDAARERARASRAPLLDQVRFTAVDEGWCVQTLHRGPFDDEGPVLQRMHEEFIPANGLVLSGIHHEIYLSDIRRTAPQRWRTILRQPVTRA